MAVAVWAHRGEAKNAPENTLAAFEAAIRVGADGIELDVQVSADQEVVVTHDESVKRMTGYDGEVAKMSLAELRRLDFGFACPGFGRHQIPTLAETLDLLKPTDLVLNIELKNSVHLFPGLEAQILDLAVAHNMVDRICLSSFNHYSMIRAAELIRERGLAVPCGLLYACTMYEPWIYAARLGLQALHPLLTNLLVPNLVSDCRAVGIAVNAWTIDEPAHLRAAFALGVDAIITNVPERALEIRRQLADMP